MMKTVVIFLLCTTVTLRAIAAPAEEAPVSLVEVKEEPKAEVKPEETVPEVHSRFCPSRWEYYGGNCYLLNNDYKTWKDAASFCANYKGTLASVPGPLENSHLQRMARRASHGSIWTGGYHFENTWRWQDGSKFSFRNFESEGPTSLFRCLRLQTHEYSGWFNTDCSSTAPSICQVKAGC